MKVYGLPPTGAIQSSLPSIVPLGTGLAQAFSSYMGYRPHRQRRCQCFCLPSNASVP